VAGFGIEVVDGDAPLLRAPAPGQDLKGFLSIEGMRPAELAVYGALCGWALARSHARSGDAPAISGYLGSSPTFDMEIGELSHTCADQNARDFAVLNDGIESGRVLATFDI
jgi:hypothetical protein